MELPVDIQSKLDPIFDENEQHYEEGDYQKCIALHKKAWALFPEPKYDYPEEGYALVQGLVDLNLLVNQLDEAAHWAENLQQFDQEDFLGTTEFALGKVYYAMDRIDEAKEQFALAMKKSEGRVFEGEDKKYSQLLKK